MFAEEKPRCWRCRSNRFAITSTASASCISTAASKSKPRTTAHRRAGSGACCACNGMSCTFVCSIPRRATAARTRAPEAGMVSHQRRGSSQAHAAAYSQLLGRAGRAGSHIGALCDAIHRAQGEVGVRRILGVLSLAKKYGAAATDEACAAALEMGVQEYRFVRRYLERCPQAPLSLQQVDPLIRELVQYRDFINYKTKEIEE